jgi:hypothetical protein
MACTRMDFFFFRIGRGVSKDPRYIAAFNSSSVDYKLNKGTSKCLWIQATRRHRAVGGLRDDSLGYKGGGVQWRKKSVVSRTIYVGAFVSNKSFGGVPVVDGLWQRPNLWLPTWVIFSFQPT